MNDQMIIPHYHFPDFAHIESQPERYSRDLQQENHEYHEKSRNAIKKLQKKNDRFGENIKRGRQKERERALGINNSLHSLQHGFAEGL